VDLPAPTNATLSPLLLITLAAAGAGAAWPLRNAARAGASATGWRIASAAGALVLLAVAFVSPLATVAAHYLLTAHLIQVTLVMGFVPPLLLLALAGSLPPRLPRALVRLAGAAGHPAVAIVLVNAVFFGWHAPVLYDACLRHVELYSLQQVTLLLVSLVFWWPIVEPFGRGRWSMGRLGKLGYILLATVPQTFAGLIFALAHHPFYAGYLAAPVLAGMSHATDQQIAGACMALLSKLALFAAFMVLLWRLLDPSGDDSTDSDDGGGGRRDAPQPVPPGVPNWVRLLDRGPTVEEPGTRPREPLVPAG